MAPKEYTSDAGGGNEFCPRCHAPRLNPRRRMHAQRLIDYLIMFGRKLWLPRYYGHILDMAGLEDWQTDQATDDLFNVGLVDIRECGDGVVVELVSDNLDVVPRTTAPRRSPPPRNGYHFRRRPSWERGRA